MGLYIIVCFFLANTMLVEEHIETHCFFCQKVLDDKRRARTQDMTYLNAFLTQKCHATPFLYRSLLNITSSEQLSDISPMVCIACVNWKLRCGNGLLARSRNSNSRRRHCTSYPTKFTRPLLQIDQLLLFLVNPGKHFLPDRRCLLRLIESMQNRDNVFLQSIMPQNVLTIVGQVDTRSPLVVNDLIRAWWEYNNQPVFMMHSETARLVRNMLKNGDSERVLFDMDEEGLQGAHETAETDNQQEARGAGEIDGEVGIKQEELPEGS